MWDAVTFARICRNRPLRVVATHGEATKPSASECRAFRLVSMARAEQGAAERRYGMKRLVLCCAACGAVSFLSGCASQTLRTIEYYEPTDSTLHERDDGLKVGADAGDRQVGVARL